MEETKNIPGVVISCEQTNSRVNEELVYLNSFSYHYQNQKFQGESFATGTFLNRGNSVQVEILKNTPSISRISGMRSAPFPIFVVGFVAIFPIIGLFIIGGGMWKGLQTIISRERPDRFRSRSKFPSSPDSSEKALNQSFDEEFFGSGHFQEDEDEFQEMLEELEDLEKNGIREQPFPSGKKFSRFKGQSFLRLPKINPSPSPVGIIATLLLPTLGLAVNLLGYYFLTMP